MQFITKSWKPGKARCMNCFRDKYSHLSVQYSNHSGQIPEMRMESEPRNPEFYTCVADVTVPAAAGA